MQDTKVRFSEKELNVISDPDIFYVKHRITEKIFDLFETLRSDYRSLPEHDSFSFPKGVDTTSGKVSQGENYRQLPYIIMDFPKYFSRDSIFVFRTMFWWGHFFSFTLQIHGEALINHRPVIANNYKKLLGAGFYICINDTPWNHTFEKNNYRLIDDISEEKFQQVVREKKFIKIARYLPLQQWSNIGTFASKSYKQCLNLLSE
jgi:hypothetical protein